MTISNPQEYFLIDLILINTYKKSDATDNLLHRFKEENNYP